MRPKRQMFCPGCCSGRAIWKAALLMEKSCHTMCEGQGLPPGGRFEGFDGFSTRETGGALKRASFVPMLCC